MINPINLILLALECAVRRGRILLSGAAALGSCVPPAAHTLTVGTNIWPGYEPGYIAELHQLYGNAAIDMRQMQSASDLLRAFRNGSLDVVALTLDDALKLQRDGYDIRMLGVVDISNGLDAIVAHPPIARVDQLNGKAVAVENSALVVIERRAFWSSLFADQNQQPLMVQPAYAALALPLNHQVEWRGLFRPEVRVRPALRDWRNHYDFVLVRGYAATTARIPAHLRLLYARDGVALFRVV